MDRITGKQKNFVLAIILFFTGYAALGATLQPLDADEYWAWAKKKDTSQAYRCFVYHYPDDSRTVEAKERWAELDFEKAREEDTPAAYRRFLRLHPDSHFANAVKDKYLRLHDRSSIIARQTFIDTSLAHQAFNVLLAGLKDSDRRVSGKSTVVLGEIGDPRAVDALMGTLKHPLQDKEAAEAISRISDPRAVDTLISALKNSDRLVRSCAARTLGEIGDPRAVDSLLRALKDPDETLRYYAARALGKIGDQRAADPLINMFDDPDSSVRNGAAEAVCKIVTPHTVSSLIHALKNRNAEVCTRAAMALGEIGDPCAVDSLILALRHSHPWLRYCTATALGQIGDPRATDALLRVLEEQNSKSSEHVTVTLIPGERGQLVLASKGQIVDALAVTAAHDKWLRFYIALSLGETGNCWIVDAVGSIGDPRAVDALSALLNHNNKWVRFSAVEALQEIGSSGAVDALIATIMDSSSQVRLSAVDALIEIGDSCEIDAIISELKNPLIEDEVAFALGKTGDLQSIDTLANALRDPDDSVRNRAVFALGRSGNPLAVDALIGALKDPSCFVHQNAARALGDIGNPRAVVALIAALKRFNRIWLVSEDVHKIDCPLFSFQIKVGADKVRIRGCGSNVAVDGVDTSINPEIEKVAVLALWPNARSVNRSIESLARIALKNDSRALQVALKDSDERVRQGAAEAFAMIAEKRWELLLEEKRTGEPPKKPIETSGPPPRRTRDILAQIKAAGSRVHMGDTQALPKLHEGLDSSSIDVQFAAISALSGAINRVPSVTKDLKKALAETKSETLKLKITGELAKNKDPEAIKEIKKYLKSEDTTEVIYAATVLGQAEKQGIAKELIAALDDEDALVRVHAATAILRILQSQAATKNRNGETESVSTNPTMKTGKAGVQRKI